MGDVALRLLCTQKGLVFVCYITGAELPDPHKREILKYILNHQNADGGWGLYDELFS
jgi:hypothetical protein